MEKSLWNESFFDRRTWILDHLESLQLDTKETVVLLLIDYCNQIHTMVNHEFISEKSKLSVDEIEEVFMALSDKGYLTIQMDGGNLIFNIEGVYQQENIKGESLSRTVFETFEYEFKRPLSHSEMQRIMEMVSTYDERRVICALNEAVVYEKVNLNYIERILMNWMQKGLSIEDLENGKR